MAEPSSKKRREEVNVDKCEALLTKVWNADVIKMFHHPVDEAIAPGYSKLIAEPIDLSTIRNKLRAGNYDSNRAVLSDLRLMFSNALEFNEKGSSWFVHAKKLLKQLREMIHTCGLKKYDDEDSDDEMFIPEGTVEDKEAKLAKAERKIQENVPELLKTLEDDLNVPLEVLRAKYQTNTSKNVVAHSDSSSAGSTESSSSGDDSSDEESSADDSTEDDSVDSEEDDD